MPCRKTTIVALLCVTGYLSSCFLDNERSKNIKDFDQHMLDLRIYHENLGDALVSKNKEYAKWFINDMDSILILMTIEFPTHRKLEKSFRYHYEKRLARSMKNLKQQIDTDKWPEAISTYSTLTKKCNNCHFDHYVDKEVRDVTQK